jgi:hypothetical protein
MRPDGGSPNVPYEPHEGHANPSLIGGVLKQQRYPRIEFRSSIGYKHPRQRRHAPPLINGGGEPCVPGLLTADSPVVVRLSSRGLGDKSNPHVILFLNPLAQAAGGS